jgi:hypothetical protein
MKPLRKDPALWFFGLVALACLSVSIPATLIAMELFHGATWDKPAVVVFEIGAVGAELATIAIPQWRRRLMFLTILLLLATSGTNYAHGADLFVQAAAPGTYEAIRGAGYGWLLAAIAAGMFPALLFVFLTAFTARWRMLRARYDTPLKVVAFWLAVFGHYMDTRVSAAEHARAAAEQRVLLAEQAQVDAEHQLEEVRRRAEHELVCVRHELNTRPPAVEVEVIQVVRARLTYEQASQMFGVSVSTIRRKLPQLESTNGHVKEAA